jgi:tetratricopeptide (TPR) repeat protein
LTAPSFTRHNLKGFVIFPSNHPRPLSCGLLPRAAFALAVLTFSTLANAQTKPPASAQANFDSISSQAEQASRENRLDDAIVLYRKALALRPSWADGWWALGTIHYDRDEYQPAVLAFRKLISLQPAKGSPRVMLGLCDFELGDDDGALKNIEEGKQRGINTDEQFQKVMVYHEGVLLLRKGRFNSAGERFSDLSKLNVHSDELNLGFAMSALRMLPKNLPEENTPGRAVLRRVGKAEALLATKKFDEARREYASLVADYPGFPNIYYAYGRFLLELSDVDAAVAAFQQEIKNSPQHIPARLQIAAARYRLDSADGLKYAKEAVQLDPAEPFGHYLLGLLYLDTQDFPAAIFELEIAKRSYPKIPDVYFALGNAYARAGQKQAAAQARAAFTRLNAANKKESMETVNQDRPPAIATAGSAPAPDPKVPQ